MTSRVSSGGEQVRCAELIAALCLATDLGMGFPFEHGLHSTLIATRLTERLGVDATTASGAYYTCLLMHSGCTTNAHVTAELFGDSLTRHFNPVMYGSRREVMGGLVRAMPPPESAGPGRALQAARRFPKVALTQRSQLTAMCEVAEKLGDEWEQVRLHPYHTERVLSRSPFLSALGRIAGTHDERLDGSGYHRGSKGAELPLPARLIAAADAYHAMTEPRPHRATRTPEQAADEIAHEATLGRFDADAAKFVIEAAGQPVPPIERPAALTEREAEVVGMLARGLQTKQVARALGISVKTADHHIQNAYGKIGVSTRAAATLFAMEPGLVAWGELPIVRPAHHS